MATRAGLQWQRNRYFYTVMAAVSAAIVFAGFARTFYLRSHFVHAPLAPLLVLHGVVFTTWLLLLLVQVSLVTTGRTHLHRRLGLAGAGLAALMAVVGFAALIYAGRHGFTPPGGPPPLVFLVIPFFDIIVFEGLFVAAFLYRRRPQAHKRLMILATVAILPPAIARLPFAFIQPSGPLAFFGLADVVLLACVLYDVSRLRKLHSAWLWGGAAILISQPLRLALGHTAAWLAFAHWLIR